jgi:hypothetical protein
MLEMIGMPFVVTRVEPFAAPGLCCAYVEPRPADA